jgi:anaerobic magnesium-protoporphyrin IX monomethyl ester cyclase
MHLDLIVGLPLDYEADVINSIEKVFDLYPDELQLGFLKFLKGTPMRENTEAHGYRFHKDPPYEIISSNYLSEHTLQRIKWAEHMIEVFWNKKRAKRTLTLIHHTDSIFSFLSDLGRFFVQNIGWVGFGNKEAYNALLDYILNHIKNPSNYLEKLVIDYYAGASTFPGLDFAVKALGNNAEIKKIGKKIAIKMTDGYWHFEYQGNTLPRVSVS